MITDTKQFQMKIAAFILMLISVFTAVLISKQLYINRTESIPLGIYVISNKAIGRYDHVSICPDNSMIFKNAVKMRIIKKNQIFKCDGFEPLLKRVYGIPGDIIDYNNGFFINGQLISNSTRIYNIQHQSDLNMFDSYVLKDDEFLVLSEREDAFDSRYFGLVNKNINSMKVIEKKF